MSNEFEIGNVFEIIVNITLSDVWRVQETSLDKSFILSNC